MPAASDKHESTEVKEEYFVQYGPGQIMAKDGKGTGKWIYVGWMPDYTWRVGFCAAGCPGHASADEAEQHQREWVSLFETSYWVANHRQVPCTSCGSLTDQCARLDWVLGRYIPLCSNHMSPTQVETLVGSLTGLIR